VRFENKNIFVGICKNALAYYTGVAVVNSEVVRLAPGFFCCSCKLCLKEINVFFRSATLVPFLLLGSPIYSDNPFLVHHPVNQDDQHLLAHAMASDFTVAWQFFSKRTIVFLVTDQIPCPYLTRSLPALLKEINVNFNKRK
jgi:hypothetical protein